MTMFLQESKMKISLAVIAISGCLVGIIDALRCYDCKDRTEADQGSPDDKNVYGICSEEGQAYCEEGEVCVSLFFEGYAVVSNFFEPDREIIFTHIARSCGPANPEQTIDEICQDYADFGPFHTFSKTTCKRETCETELCNTHGNENLQGPVEEAGEDGAGEGGEGGAGEGGEGGAGDEGEGGAGDGGEGGAGDGGGGAGDGGEGGAGEGGEGGAGDGGEGGAGDGGEGGAGDGGEGGAGEGGEGGAGDKGEGGAGDEEEGGVDDDTQGGDAQYSSGITHTVSALLAATTALCY